MKIKGNKSDIPYQPLKAENEQSTQKTSFKGRKTKLLKKLINLCRFKSNRQQTVLKQRNIKSTPSLFPFFKQSPSKSDAARLAASTPPEPGMEIVDLRFTPATFDIYTQWKTFPLSGAKKLYSQLKNAEQWQRTNDLEKILPQFFQLESQLEAVKAEVKRGPEQYYHYQKGKIKLLPPGSTPRTDSLEMKDMRMEGCNTLNNCMKEFLKALSPEHEIAKLNQLEEKHASGKLDDDTYKTKTEKLLQAIKNKQGRYQKIKYHPSPQTKIHARKWLNQTDEIIRQFNRPSSAQ